MTKLFWPALGMALLVMPAGAAPMPTPTLTVVPAAMEASPRIWMEGDRVLVSGSALGFSSEDEARKRAIQDAADTAAKFLEKRGFGPSQEISHGVEQALLRETKLRTFSLGDVKVENTYQERWNGEHDMTDRYSIHLTLSIRLKNKKDK